MSLPVLTSATASQLEAAPEYTAALEAAQQVLAKREGQDLIGSERNVAELEAVQEPIEDVTVPLLRRNSGSRSVTDPGSSV